MPKETTSTKSIVEGYRKLLAQPLLSPDVSGCPISTKIPERDARRCAVLLSPHPDDECLNGLLPLRLMREENWQIVNIAVTLGSDVTRRAARLRELERACAVTGFASLLPEENGFSNINMATRRTESGAWMKRTQRLAQVLSALSPQAIFMPHAEDGHQTHMGTHYLAMDALALLPQKFTCPIVLTEYWQALESPNVLVEAEDAEIATLLEALACHKGEVARNAYDKRFPAYLIDSVRRAELMSGVGKPVPPMDFGQMVQIGLWKNGKFVPSGLNHFIKATNSVGTLFA